MATTDFSGTPDAQMEYIMGLLENNPEFIPNVEERRAFVAEYFRRKQGGAAVSQTAGKPASPQPSNVDNNLAAAARPLSLEPVVETGPDTMRRRMVGAGFTPQEADMAAKREMQMPHAFAIPESDEALRRGAAYVRRRDGANAAMDQALAQAMGHDYDPRESSPLYAGGRSPSSEEESRYRAAHGFLPGDMTTWEGVQVPVRAVDGKGRPMSTLGDLRRAQDAADDARLSEMFSQSAQEDLANYGTRQMKRYKYDANGRITGVEDVEPSLLSDAEQQQQRNLNARRKMELGEQRQNAALRNRPGLNRLESAEDARRALVAQNAMLAGGSQNLNPVVRARLGTLAAASDPTTPAEIRQLLRYSLPGGTLAAQVDAENAAMGGRMAQSAMTAFLTNNPQATPEQRALFELQMREKEEALPAAAAAQRERARTGVVAASSPAGQRLLKDIETNYIGPYATPAEVIAAREAAMAAGVPEEEARRYFSRRESFYNWMAGGGE